MDKYCKGCGAPFTSGGELCPVCDARMPAAKNRGATNHNHVAGERDGSGTFTLFKASVCGGIHSLRQLLKKPKQLIPLLVLSVIWLILSMLPALGINPLPVQMLSFFTFAQGGMYGGVWGAIGGVIGKVVFTYFVYALIVPLFSGKNPFKGMGKGVKTMFAALVVQSANAVAQPMLGAGLALIVFNFLTGNASMVNSMAGVIGLVLAIRSLLSKGGFLWTLLLSVANKLSKGRVPNSMIVSRVMAGYAVGSAACIALAAVRIAYLPYALGGLLLIVGIIVGIAVKPKKEAAV